MTTSLAFKFNEFQIRSPEFLPEPLGMEERFRKEMQEAIQQSKQAIAEVAGRIAALERMILQRRAQAESELGRQPTATPIDLNQSPPTSAE